MITSGAPQSNHARLTAAAATRLGLGCVLVLAGPPPEIRRGNLLLDGSPARRSCGWGPPARRGGGGRGGEAIGVRDPVRWHVTRVGAGLRGLRPGVAGPGAGHRRAEVVVALGSGGTMAGLVRELGVERVVGVDTGALPDPRATVAGLLAGEVEPAALRIDGSQVGAGTAR
ncbi:hypothetical protein NKG94_04835 [Micromonospora sp. M12]